MTLPGYVVPGQTIVAKNDNEFPRYASGCGTEISEQGISAMILGKLVVEKQKDGNKWRIDIINEFSNPYAQIPAPPTGNSVRGTSQLPQVGDVVYAKVLRLSQQQVNLDIIAVENKGNTAKDNGVGQFASSIGSVHPASGNGDRISELGEGYGAVIRIQDIRASERDKIQLLNQFAPGDLVRASVLSLGDESNYYLSTIRNDLGVVFARDELTGAQLVPLDWQTMIDPTSGMTYPRKCANPFI